MYTVGDGEETADIEGVKLFLIFYLLYVHGRSC